MTDSVTPSTPEIIPLVRLSTTEDSNSTILFTGWINSLNMVIDNMNSLMLGDYVKDGNLTINNEQIGIVANSITINGNALTKYVQFKDSSISDNIGVTREYGYRHIYNTTKGIEGDAQFPIYNPHGDSTANIGFDLLDNTAFKDKPISKETEDAISVLEDVVEKMHVFDDTVKSDGTLAVKLSGIKSFFDSIILPIRTSAYPVGSYYMNATNNDNPSTIFGFGEWIKIDTGVTLMTAGTGNPVDSTGGSYTVTLNEDHIFAHTHTATVGSSNGAHTHGRGNMNFTAEFWGTRLGANNSLSKSGAFTPSVSTGGGAGATNTQEANAVINLDASRNKNDGTASWTGTTSSSGVHSHTFTLDANVSETSPINIVQPYYVVNTWRRTK